MAPALPPAGHFGDPENPPAAPSPLGPLPALTDISPRSHGREGCWGQGFPGGQKAATADLRHRSPVLSQAPAGTGRGRVLGSQLLGLPVPRSLPGASWPTCLQSPSPWAGETACRPARPYGANPLGPAGQDVPSGTPSQSGQALVGDVPSQPPSPRSHGWPQALLRGLWSQMTLSWPSHSPSLPSSSPAFHLLRGPTS